MPRKMLLMHLLSCLLFSFFLCVLLETCDCEAHAEMVKPRALGGLSLTIEQFYDRGGELYDDSDLHLLSAVMELENGGSNDRCILLTGSVVLNRVASPHWPDTIRDVIFQGYNGKGAQQYATSTIKRIDSVKVSGRVTELARQLMLFGSIAPSNVVYQSRYAHQGSGNYEVINGEYFAYE